MPTSATHKAHKQAAMEMANKESKTETVALIIWHVNIYLMCNTICLRYANPNRKLKYEQMQVENPYILVLHALPEQLEVINCMKR